MAIKPCFSLRKSTRVLVALEDYQSSYDRWVMWRCWLYVQDEGAYRYLESLKSLKFDSSKQFEQSVRRFRFSSKNKLRPYLAELALFYWEEILWPAHGITIHKPTSTGYSESWSAEFVDPLQLQTLKKTFGQKTFGSVDAFDYLPQGDLGLVHGLLTVSRDLKTALDGGFLPIGWLDKIMPDKVKDLTSLIAALSLKK